jgi:UDP-N-acetylmuramoyl-L-alanyl-D-glutamate--2,6-diaminopimelate ligase
MALQRPTTPPFSWADDLFTIGVTGTNGKTSTTVLAAAALHEATGGAVAITTLGYFIDDVAQDVPRTTRSFIETFRRAHAKGIRYGAVECTSLALARGYAKRWRFDVGVFTNLSPDHLATHGSWEHYLASKAQLFAHLGPGCAAVLNAGDESSLLLDRVIFPDVRRIWYHVPSRGPQLRPADLVAARIEVSAGGTAIELVASELADALGGRLDIRLVGEVFAENALAAAAACLSAGLDGEAVRRGLAGCPGVSGRFEVVATDPIVVIDYAHTPDALARTCDAARGLGRRLIVVFGAGGGATPQKREPMGFEVGKRADVAVLTSDNPRDEDPRVIAEALRAGVVRGGRARVVVELDRKAAIGRALELARSRDVVVVAGKGHERGQHIRGESLPFDDRDQVLELLGAATGSPAKEEPSPS